MQASSTPHADTDQDGEQDGKRRAVWLRGGYMLLFLVAFGIAQSLLALISVVQFVTLLIAGRANDYLADFGRGLAMWLAETCGFLTCATERRPFPFAPWPRVD